MPVLSGSEPFAHDGSDDIGVLLCHGFTSTPQSMRGWGEHLAAAGITVRCPLLPGHGTRWQDLNRTRWTDWYAVVERELTALRERCRSVFAFGQSMGGALALRLAQRHPDIAAPDVVELAYDRMPLRAFASLRRLWTVVRADLPAVRQPLLLYRSAVDHVVEPVNSELVLGGVRSRDVTEIVLANSFHVATLDHDAPRVFAGSVDFLHRIHRERVEEPA